jgi:hypothetical protein
MDASERKKIAKKLTLSLADADKAWSKAFETAIWATEPGSPARLAVVALLSPSIDRSLTAQRAINVLAGRAEFDKPKAA